MTVPGVMPATVIASDPTGSLPASPSSSMRNAPVTPVAATEAGFGPVPIASVAEAFVAETCTTAPSARDRRPGEPEVPCQARRHARAWPASARRGAWIEKKSFWSSAVNESGWPLIVVSTPGRSC